MKKFVYLVILICFHTHLNAQDLQSKNTIAEDSDKTANSEVCNEKLAKRLLETVESNIIPLTAEYVKKGNKLFGAALLKKSDLSVVLAATNNETENPLWHGEVHLLKLFYEMPESDRPDPRDMIFLATHEPCPLCLSAITWGGYDNFYYLFSYEDSRDEFQIPHDLKILKEVFMQDGGNYARQNYYWSSKQVVELVEGCPAEVQKDFKKSIDGLKKEYDALSDEYQKHKDSVSMPLK